MLAPDDNESVKSIHVCRHCLGEFTKAEGGQEQVAGDSCQQDFCERAAELVKDSKKDVRNSRVFTPLTNPERKEV